MSKAPCRYVLYRRFSLYQVHLKLLAQYLQKSKMCRSRSLKIIFFARSTGSFETKREVFEGDDGVAMTGLKTCVLLTLVDMDPDGSEITMPKLTKIRNKLEEGKPTSLRFSSSTL